MNLKAFLDTIAYSELGPLIGLSDNGYNVIVGSTPKNPDLFDDYSDHPRKLVTMTIKGNIVKSTAAGRYQVLERYFDHYKKQLDLPDFGHESQDRIAIQLIRECKALEDIEAGRFDQAAFKCRSRWASLPGAGYQQHENDLADLQAKYVEAGGTLA
jgi:muramidase (phage lysozyme)